MKVSRKLLFALLLIPLLVGLAGATAYVILEWQVNMTVTANPKVAFIKWQDSTKHNNFSYSVNIFPNIKTVDPNATFGVWNWDSSAHDIYFRLASENTNSTDVAWFYYKVYDGGTLFSKNETNFDSPDTAWSSSVSATATTKYTIEVQVKCGSGAGAGHTPQLTLEMRVDNP